MQQHHAAEAQSGRIRARPRDWQQGARAGAGDRTSVHNTPFGDIVDTEDDLQPLVFSMFRDATRMVKLVAAAIATAEFDAERLETSAGDGWTTLTELADTLVRDHGLPFKTAHAIAARLVAGRRQRSRQSAVALLAEATEVLLGTPLPYTDRELEEDSQPAALRERPQNIRRAGPRGNRARDGGLRIHFDADQTWWTGKMTALTDAEQRLAARAQAL